MSLQESPSHQPEAHQVSELTLEDLILREYQPRVDKQAVAAARVANLLAQQPARSNSLTFVRLPLI
jgi:hypothetical protein